MGIKGKTMAQLGERRQTPGRAFPNSRPQLTWHHKGREDFMWLRSTFPPTRLPGHAFICSKDGFNCELKPGDSVKYELRN